MVEIVGFPGQTAPTTRFEIEAAPTPMYMETNYLTISASDSGAVLVAEKRVLLPARPFHLSFYLITCACLCSFSSSLLRLLQSSHLVSFIKFHGIGCFHDRTKLLLSSRKHDLRHSRASSVEGLRLERSSPTVFFAAENSSSTSADIAGRDRIAMAIRDNVGNRVHCAVLVHHSKAVDVPILMRPSSI